MKAFKINENYRLRKLARLSKGNRVLDVGCTEMPNQYIQNKFVVGLDLDRGDLPSNYSKLYIGNVFNLPNCLESEDKFDSIIIGEVLEHIYDPVLFLKKCTTVLKNGGRIILSTPNPHSPMETILTVFLNKKFYYSKDHKTLFPQRWLIRIMENAGLSNIELFSGGLPFPFLGLIPFPRPFCYQTIATGEFFENK